MAKKLDRSIKHDRRGCAYIRKYNLDFMPVEFIEASLRQITGFEGKMWPSTSDTQIFVRYTDESRRCMVYFFQTKEKDRSEWRLVLAGMMVHDHELLLDYLTSLSDKFFDL